MVVIRIKKYELVGKNGLGHEEYNFAPYKDDSRGCGELSEMVTRIAGEVSRFQGFKVSRGLKISKYQGIKVSRFPGVYVPWVFVHQEFILGTPRRTPRG